MTHTLEDEVNDIKKRMSKEKIDEIDDQIIRYFAMCAITNNNITDHELEIHGVDKRDGNGVVGFQIMCTECHRGHPTPTVDKLRSGLGFFVQQECEIDEQKALKTWYDKKGVIK